MKKNMISILLFLLIAESGVCTEKKTILFMPFINEGSYRFDRLKTHIPNYLYEPVKNLPGYHAVSYAELRAYMAEQGIAEADLKRYAIVEKTGLHFDADYIIHGYFIDRGDEITISFSIYKRSGDEYLPNHDIISVKLEDLHAPALNTSLDSLIRICEKVTESRIEPGYITIITNPSCRLLIDSEPKGQTPIRLALHPGEHRITIMYDSFDKEEVVLDEVAVIEKDNTWHRFIDIFVPLTINAEEKCIVYLNGSEVGPTPFHGNLFWGREYMVKVVYYGEKGREQVVYEKLMNTREPVPPLYLSAKAGLTLDFPSRFSAGFGEEATVTLPYTFSGLVPGDYSLRIILDDPEWKRQWIYSDKKITLLPFEKTLFNRETTGYEKNWPLLFIPPALQFHNRQPVKGTLLLTGFLTTAAVTGVFAGLWIHYRDELNHMVDSVNSGEDNYENTEIEYIRRMKNGFSDLFLGGIITGALIYLFSGIDGIITMNHLYGLVNRE